MPRRSSLTPGPNRSIAAIGSVSWDRLLVVDNYPAAGGVALLDRLVEAPGGNTGNTVVALAQLGVSVRLEAMISADSAGARLRAALRASGVRTDRLRVHPEDPTDECTIIVSGSPPERTIYWRRGARLGPDDHLDLDALAGYRVLLLDVDSEPLIRSVLARLAPRPAPRPCVLGTLQNAFRFEDALELLLQYDVITGNESEWRQATRTANVRDAIAIVQARMSAVPLRAFFITLGRNGCLMCTEDRTEQIAGYQVDVVDPTGAGDAFTAGLAYGLLYAWDWIRTARFANATAALSTRALGGQSALPTLAEVNELLAERGGRMSRLLSSRLGPP